MPAKNKSIKKENKINQLGHLGSSLVILRSSWSSWGHHLGENNIFMFLGLGGFLAHFTEIRVNFKEKNMFQKVIKNWSSN